jgi:hypothetical protein
VFCRQSSVNANDIELMDNVFPHTVDESITVHYGAQQDWCFLDKQREDEVIIFQGGDSKIGLCGGKIFFCLALLFRCVNQIIGVPHCSFNDKRYGDDVRPRESIEVRALVFYTEEDLDLQRLVPSRMHGPESTYAQEKPVVQ